MSVLRFKDEGRTDMIVFTVEDVLLIILVVVWFLLFIGAMVAGGVLRFGDWLFRRGAKEDDDEKKEQKNEG